MMRVRMVAWLILCSVLLPPVAGSAQAQSAASAKTFLNSIFRLYENSGKGTPYSSRYLHASLHSLIRADLKAADAASEVPWPLDADIICDCQEWGGIWIHKMDIKLVGTERAIAVVSFDFETPDNRSSSDVRSMRYTLVAEHGEWRIYDVEDLSRAIESGESRSLRKQILKDIESFKIKSP
jgi:hypothetical protein